MTKDQLKARVDELQQQARAGGHDCEAGALQILSSVIENKQQSTLAWCLLGVARLLLSDRKDKAGEK